MILRCTAPRKNNRFLVCDGLIGAAPDGAVVVRSVRRLEEVTVGYYGMDCRTCKTFWEVRPPREEAA